MIQTALGFHRQGRLAEAEQAYQSILRQEPNHFEALHCLGLLKLQQGNGPEAATLISKAVEQRPQALDALCNLAAAFMALERYDDALGICDRVLAAAPRDAEALFNRGVALMQLRRHSEALASFERALTERPDHIKAWFNRGNVLAAQERYADALASYDRVLALNPSMLQAIQNRGNVLVKLGRCEEALGAFASVLALAPGKLDAQNSRAIALREAGRYDEALDCCDRMTAADPNYTPAWVSRGNVLLKLQRADEALAAFDKALAVRPGDAEVLNNRGLALYALDRHQDALASYEQALAVEPKHPGALNNRGVVLHKLDRLEEALLAWDTVLSIVPSHREALINRGTVLTSLNRPEEALASYERALAIKADDADILNRCAAVLFGLRRYDEGLACNERILQLDPDALEAHVAKAGGLAALGHFDAALLALERALTIRADFPDALAWLGYVHARLRRFDQASACYERLLAIDSNRPGVLGELAHCYLCMCDWKNLARIAPELQRRIGNGTSVFHPFVLLGFPVKPLDLLECTKRHVRATIPKPARPLGLRRTRRPGALRVAYLSANFHRNAGGYLTAGLFEHHDRSHVEPIGISFGPDDNSDVRERLVRAFDRFHDVSSLNDAAVAAMLRDMDVDIAVDLMGHTEGTRLGILAWRPAPIQAAFLGYPGPMGADFIDYVIADKIVLPPDQQPFYGEQIVRLPDSYQVNDSKRLIAERVPSRGEMGLPEQGFVFCCFNQVWKINEPTFDVWMRLLRAVEGSVLWLYHFNDLANANLLKQAQAHGVEPQRLVFASYCEQPDHLARHKLADLVLDTLPYNAHTTASDALWAGVPLVTCRGSTFAGRVAASLLNAIGRPELVTDSLDEYEALALKLATDPALLRSIQSKLERNRLSYALFDTARFARHIEGAYETMWETWQRGEPPRSFSVEPIAG